jgi:hypothetical protein
MNEWIPIAKAKIDTAKRYECSWETERVDVQFGENLTRPNQSLLAVREYDPRPYLPTYRPFNADEAIKIIGRIVHHKSGSRSMITGANGIMFWCEGKAITTQDLLNNYVFDDDGSQCGVAGS